MWDQGHVLSAWHGWLPPWLVGNEGCSTGGGLQKGEMGSGLMSSMRIKDMGVDLNALCH